MSFNIKIGGTWETVTSAWVKVAGTWEQVLTGWIKVAGTWQQVLGLTLNGGTGGTVSQSDAVAPYDTTVGIRFNTDGTVETGVSQNGAAITWSPAGNWITPTSAASGDYDVRFTNMVHNVGASDWTTEAAADDTWIALSAQRTWLSNRTLFGPFNFTCDFEVRDGGGAPPDTGSSEYTFDIDNTS